ncbi:MAG: DUF294 nucleotidyltransferase-like domain-containing protein [Pseudomonadota bacterium]
MSIGRSATPLISLDAIVIDTETTGLDPARARIVDIALVPLEKGRIEQDQASRFLIRPDVPIPVPSTRIHGIDAAMVSDAPAFAAVWPGLLPQMDDTVIIGHTVAFDLAVIKRECDRAGLAWRAPPSLCTRMLAQVARPDLADFSLDSLAAWLGVQITGRHSALGDAMATARIFHGLVPVLRERGIRTLAEAMRACENLAEPMRMQPRIAWRQPVPGDAASVARRDVQPYNTRVAAIMTAPPLVIGSGKTVATALETMIANRVSSLLVRMDAAAMQADNTGIVTERDVMRAFSEHGPSAFAMPVVALMSYPLHVVQADALAYAAIGRMNRLQVRHLGVADRTGRVAGVLSSRDLLRLRAEGAVELADEIGSARDVHDLARAWARLAQIAGELLAEGLSASDVAAVVSQRVREMTYLAAEQAEAAMKAEGLGEPPCGYAVLVLGSAGRDESLLAMDQDNAIVFADDSPDGADVWFAELGRRMTDTLHAVGIPLCKGGVMARNPAWRGSYATWCQRVQRWISNASPESLLSVDIFFDLRAAYGDIALAQRLRAFAFDTARGDAAFAKLLLQAEGFVPSGLTWYGGIKTDQGRIDLKKAGLFGVVSAARALAICHHVTGHSTPERLRSLAALEIGGGEDIDALADARDVFLDLILRQQLVDIAAGRPPGNAVEVRRLTRRQKAALKTALGAVEPLEAFARDLLFAKPADPPPAPDGPDAGDPQT